MHFFLSRWFIVPVIIALSGVFIYGAQYWSNQQAGLDISRLSEELDTNLAELPSDQQTIHPLSIMSLKEGQYPGSEITFEETLSSGSNYQRYRVSYLSEGLKIYALLTIPNGEKPSGGWPVVLFNHGYIPPQEYRTTERYLAYTDAFSRNGYVVFRSDYRGHGSSEGEAVGGYGSNAYTIDILNALASVKTLKDTEDTAVPLVDSQRIGMWGHSMGGHITLRSMVVNKEIKAGVIWAGVVASYPDLINNWRRPNQTPFSPPPGTPQAARRWRQQLTEDHGSPEANPEFWNSLSANSYLSDISGPIQLHHGTADTSVPVEFSQKLDEQLRAADKPTELFIYNGDDHNLSRNLSVALQRSVDFFDQHLKN